MGNELAALLIFSFFYVRLCFAASHNMSNTDISSLLSLKSGFNSNVLTTNWSQETPFCTWIGVTCKHRRVTGLDLSGMGLRGKIAGEIGNLSFLTFLNISNNNISGHIPESIGLLSKLKVISLSDNHLGGEIPASFGNLSQLQQLNLRSNQLSGELSSTIFNISSLISFNVGENHMSGSIPKHICSQSSKLQDFLVRTNQFEGEFPSDLINCHYLTRLSLGENKFTGNIPSDIGNLSTVQLVILVRNNFTGTIPPSFGNLTNLVRLHIAQNSLHGTIPSEIGVLSSLTFLDLTTNKLNGEVPQSIFNLSRLQVLGLGGNNLSGYLPFSIDKGIPNIVRLGVFSTQFRGNILSSISNLSNLNLLELSINSFTGHIPITLGNLPQLQILSLYQNQFTNNLSEPQQDFLSSLTACKYLKVIQIESNPITGVLPKSLGSTNLSASLQRFVADSCRIRSPLPIEIGNLSNLIMLTLPNNELTGSLPATFGDLRNLQVLDVQSNKFQGSIPHVICNLENLYFLCLAGNGFFGQLPRCLGKLSMLRQVYLQSNALNFTIPPTLWFHEHVERINIANNFLHGSLPGDIGNMKDLKVLDLSGNQLTGEIPTSVSQLQKLSILSLSDNNLIGPILASLADLHDLQYLGLSHNHLSGPIPTSLEKLVNLEYFNASFNELSGEIPHGGPFLNFTAENFAGNKGLCGLPQFKMGECKRSKMKPSSKRHHLKCILPVIASVIVATIIIIFVLRCRGKKLYPQSDLPLLVMPARIFSYIDIMRATNNLDERNLIGRGSSGSVYKGNFPDPMVAAIKVFNSNVQDAFKSFDTECQILRSIRHRNLVRVITSCSNLDFKALVMEYMPNGNLESWLHSNNPPLNIFQRLGILIDVAFAVEYLHEGDTSPIVHCDLKPNNILLDEGMVAHVGDFGIAKLLTQEQRMLHTQTLGTIGYIAPEYGSEGLVSPMADAYSYGILLMEVVTVRKPTDEMFSGELTMRRWVSESFPNKVMQIVDRELLNMDDQRSRARHERCLTSMFKLALECTSDLADERPNMKDVVARMNKINQLICLQ